MKALAPEAQKKRVGRPLEFSDKMIEVFLLIKIHYKMLYRMLEGFIRFFFGYMKGIKVPSYSLTINDESCALTF